MSTAGADLPDLVYFIVSKQMKCVKILSAPVVREIRKAGGTIPEDVDHLPVEETIVLRALRKARRRQALSSTTSSDRYLSMAVRQLGTASLWMHDPLQLDPYSADPHHPDEIQHMLLNQLEELTYVILSRAIRAEQEYRADDDEAGIVVTAAEMGAA